MKSPPPIIGRSGEIDTAQRALAAGQPFAVVGPAGIGKTSLLLHAIRGAGRQVRVGGAVDFMEWRSWLPLERALGRPLTTGDPDAVALDMAADLEREVLLLDDLHWADPETLSTLDALTTHLPVMATTRDGTVGEKATRALSEAGFELLHLQPLRPSDVRTLIQTRCAGMSERTISEIVRRSGGNPLFVEQLLATGDEHGRAIQDVVAVRLDELDVDARQDVLLLALNGGPLPSSTLTGAFDELVSRGLALELAGKVSLAADLIGEVAIERADDTALRLAHRVLSEHTEELGARARHLAGAGLLPEALDSAMAAADTSDHPAERARELELASDLAARVGDSTAATRHRLAAAQIFLYAGHPEEALRLIAELRPDNADERSSSHLLAASAHFLAGNHGATLDRVQEALLAEPSDPHLAQLLGLRAASRAMGQLDIAGAREDAEAAIAIAARTGAPRRYAQHLLAGLDALAGIDGWSERFDDALEAARSEGDIAREFEIANTFAQALFMHGEVARAMAICDDGIRRSRLFRQRAWELRLRTTRASLAYFPTLGNTEILAELDDLASEPSLPSNRSGVVGLIHLARADRGDRMAYPCIVEEIRRYTPNEHMAWHGLHWIASEIALLNNLYAEAIEHAQTVLSSDGPGSPAFDSSAVVLRWAQLLADVEVCGPAPAGSLPALAGLAHEASALQSWDAGDYDDAAHDFAEAASLHDLYLRRCARRSRLAQVGTLVAGGRGTEATALARRVRVEVEAQGVPSIGPRAAALLSSLGEPVEPEVVRAWGAENPRPDPEGSGLTARQTEILLLVADGRTSAAIANELGVGTSTVESHIRAAMRSLGTRTRTEAAMHVAAHRR